MSHIGCKHLDYDGQYTDCTLIESPEGWKWWERGPIWTEGPGNEGNARNVQFCKLRGRINDIFSCINVGERPCFEAQDKVKD